MIERKSESLGKFGYNPRYGEDPTLGDLVVADDAKPRDAGPLHAQAMSDTPTTAGRHTADDDTSPLDSSCATSPDHAKFQRGRAAIELLEAIRFSQPERLADLAEPPSGNIPSDLPGTIGRFQVLRELGRGGHGVVLLAYDPHLNRRVALKVPRPETLMTPDLRRRFLREAEAAACSIIRTLSPSLKKESWAPCVLSPADTVKDPRWPNGCRDGRSPYPCDRPCTSCVHWPTPCNTHIPVACCIET